MTPRSKSLLLAGLHVALVLSLGGKLLLDRATRPRVWLRAVPVDPDTPLRGRYVSLTAELPAKVRPQGTFTPEEAFRRGPQETREVYLSVESDGRLAVSTEPGPGWSGPMTVVAAPDTLARTEPMAFFIPEHAPDPSVRARGEELWVEVTLPRKGPLRPIRLGVKKDGVLTPLPL